MPRLSNLNALRTGQRTFSKADDSVEAWLGRRIEPQPDGCWIFRGDPDNYGIARYSPQGRTLVVHRFVYETLVRELDDDEHLHHHCQTPGCCNPAHLEPMSPKEHAQEHARLRRSA